MVQAQAAHRAPGMNSRAKILESRLKPAPRAHFSGLRSLLAGEFIPGGTPLAGVRHLALPLAAILALALTGCGTSAPARFYTLASTATTQDAPVAHYAVVVGPVIVPGSVDRPQLVVQVAPNQVDIDEFNRWAAPLNDGIARAVAGDLAVLLGTSDVATAPIANFKPAYRVSLDVQRFDSMPGDAVVVEAVWTVRTTASGETRSGRTVARQTVSGKDYEALAAAHSRALAQVSGDIAVAIRTADAAAGKQLPKGKGRAKD